MGSRALFVSLTSGLLIASPAFAESIHIHESDSESESVRYSSDENGTTIESVEYKQEVQSIQDDEGDTVNISTDENDAPTVIHSESIKTVLCFGVPGGDMECREDNASNTTSTLWFGDMTSNDWWESWGNRIVESLSDDDVLAETSVTGIGTMVERTEARLARRVCNHMDGDDQEACLEDAIETSVMTMRERLETWIEMLD